MFLTIVSSSKIIGRTLQNALSHPSLDIQIVSHLKEVDPYQEDMFFLVEGHDGDDALIDLACHAPVFVIAVHVEEGATNTHVDFEEVFTRPLRLGVLAHEVHQAVAQHKMHKDLAPVTLGQFIVDPKTAYLKNTGNDDSVRLTEKELGIILFINKNQGRAVSRQNLLNEVWGYAQNVETHTLETHLYRLRQKIQTNLGVQDFLVTDDDGYRLNI